jgi:hypothetical protein
VRYFTPHPPRHTALKKHSHDAEGVLQHGGSDPDFANAVSTLVIQDREYPDTHMWLREVFCMNLPAFFAEFGHQFSAQELYEAWLEFPVILRPKKDGGRRSRAGKKTSWRQWGAKERKAWIHTLKTVPVKPRQTRAISALPSFLARELLL